MFELKETESIELKRELNESIKKELIAFANTYGGEIYIGIDDDGAIVGLDNAKQHLEAVSNIMELLGYLGNCRKSRCFFGCYS